MTQKKLVNIYACSLSANIHYVDIDFKMGNLFFRGWDEIVNIF